MGLLAFEVLTHSIRCIDNLLIISIIKSSTIVKLWYLYKGTFMLLWKDNNSFLMLIKKLWF